MAIRIITDSTCDLDIKTQKELDVEVVALTVMFEDGEYKDGVDLSSDEFFKKQTEAKVLPKTSQVNPDEFYAIFKKYVENDDDIIGIFLSSHLSGTYQSAVIASSMLEDKNIYLVDSLNATAGLGLLVREAAKMRSEGLEAAVIRENIDILKSKLRFFAVVNTLKYLKMGGRISASTAIIGEVLGISPIVSIANGKIESVGKVKGKKKVLDFISSYIEKNPINLEYPVCFAYAKDINLAQEFRENINEKFHFSNSNMNELGIVISTHSGPNCYGLVYVTK